MGCVDACYFITFAEVVPRVFFLVCLLRPVGPSTTFVCLHIAVPACLPTVPQPPVCMLSDIVLEYIYIYNGNNYIPIYMYIYRYISIYGKYMKIYAYIYLYMGIYISKYTDIYGCIYIYICHLNQRHHPNQSL